MSDAPRDERKRNRERDTHTCARTRARTSSTRAHDAGVRRERGMARPDWLAVLNIADPPGGLHLPELPAVHWNPAWHHKAKRMPRPRRLPELLHRVTHDLQINPPARPRMSCTHSLSSPITAPRSPRRTPTRNAPQRNAPQTPNSRSLEHSPRPESPPSPALPALFFNPADDNSW